MFYLAEFIFKGHSILNTKTSANSKPVTFEESSIFVNCYYLQRIEVVCMGDTHIIISR